MRPRASQVAKTRLVETEEDVETCRSVLDALKATIGDRQAEHERQMCEDFGMQFCRYSP